MYRARQFLHITRVLLYIHIYTATLHILWHESTCIIKLFAIRFWLKIIKRIKTNKINDLRFWHNYNGVGSVSITQNFISLIIFIENLRISIHSASHWIATTEWKINENDEDEMVKDEKQLFYSLRRVIEFSFEKFLEAYPKIPSVFGKKS